jgi:acetyl esterase
MTGPALPVNRVEDVSIPTPGAPIPARLYAPERDRAYPILMYLHGGGYVKGGPDESDTFCRNLSSLAAAHGDFRRLSPSRPNIRFRPRWTTRSPRPPGLASTRPISAPRQGPWRSVVKARAEIFAALTCLHARSDPRIAIRYQILLQPVIDFALTFPSIAMKPTECLVPRDEPRLVLPNLCWRGS